jgi:hypothetical protein
MLSAAFKRLFLYLLFTLCNVADRCALQNDKARQPG